MFEYFLISLAGLAGSLHCIGMCGGFVCVMGKDSRGAAATLRRHLAYNLGRVTSYCFLGGVLGHLGMLLVGDHAQPAAASLAQRSLAVVSGSMMLYIGLQFLGLFRAARWQTLGFGADLLVGALQRLLKAPGAGAPLALGVLNGFLPCPLVYAFLAQAAGSGGPLPGALTMTAFGLGTFPAMLAMGGIGVWLHPAPGPPGATVVSMTPRGNAITLAPPPAWRLHGVRIAGAFIVLLGAITIARGVLPMGAHPHGL